MIAARYPVRRVREAMCAQVVAVVMVTAGPAAAQSSYTSSVEFHWVGPPPSQILDDGGPTGPNVTTDVHNPQTWVLQQSVAMPLSRIYIAYAGEKYLLPYRSYRGAPPVRVIFGQPQFTCINNSLDGVEAALGQDVSAQISAMMAAGNLLLRPAAQCPASSRNRLVDLYFRLNCKLAGSAPYIGYLDDAERAYVARWNNEAGHAQFAQQCRQNARSAFRNIVASEVTRLAQAGQMAQAVALGQDIRSLSRQADWADTFRDYALTDVDINAWEISHLVAEQVAAQQAGQNDQAHVTNVRLLELAHDPAQRAAFDRAQVSVERVLADSRQIEGAIGREGSQPSAPH